MAAQSSRRWKLASISQTLREPRRVRVHWNLLPERALRLPTPERNSD